jgi:hypothetical protein
LIKVLNTSSFKELDYPSELKGSWFYYVFFKNHKTLGGIVCVYFNEKYPSGSVCVGDYIIKGIKGEFYPCKEDIFLETYNKEI